MSKPFTVVGSSDFAEVRFDMWTLDDEVSDRLRPMLPTARDVAMELRRALPGCIELSSEKMTGRHYVDDRNSERVWHRKPFYAVAYVNYHDFEAGNVDAVRAAYFEAVRLLAEQIVSESDSAERVAPLVLAPQAFATRVMFTDDNPLMCLVRRNDYDGAFACFDPCSDRIAFRLASYFTVVPA